MQTSNLSISFDNRKIAIIALAIQIAFLGTLSLDWLGLGISILRGILGFIYLAFIPGILLLQVLNVKEIRLIERLLYAVGLSITFLMIAGLLINSIYPAFGIKNPISLRPLIGTITAFVISLCFLLYFKQGIPLLIHIDIKAFSSYFLLLLLLPFLAFWGCYYLKCYDSNIWLIIFLLMITIILLLAIFNGQFPKKLYPLAIFVIALSLLWHVSLSSNYLYLFDTHVEYYFANLVKTNSIWSQDIHGDINSMLSIVLFYPIFSIVSGSTLTQVHTIFYPILFSFAPLGLYQLYKKFTGEVAAFLSCFLIISCVTFYTDIGVKFRQGVAEIFVVLLLLLLFVYRGEQWKRVLLLILFSFSLIVSHYGTNYFFMISLIGVGILNIIPSTKEKLNILSYGYITLYIVATLAWYIYTVGSANFKTAIMLGKHITSHIFELGESPMVYQTIKHVPLYYQELRILYFILFFLISIGFFYVIYNYIRTKNSTFPYEYICFIFTSLGFLILFTVVGGFAYSKAIGFSIFRIFHLTLFFLAPLSIIGGNFFIKSLTRNNRFKKNLSFKIISIYFIIFFLFNTGFVAEITDQFSLLPVNKPRIEKSYDEIAVVKLYRRYVEEQDFFSAKWFSEYRKNSWKVYKDSTNFHLISYGKMYRSKSGALNSDFINEATSTRNYYVYLNYLNIIKGKILEGRFEKIWNTPEFYPVLNNLNKVYSNGGSVVYCK